MRTLYLLLFICFIPACTSYICNNHTDKNPSYSAQADASGQKKITGLVASVLDGDTFVLDTGSGQTGKIRLYGIDAPELKQPWGAESKQALAALINQQPITVIIVGTDRYGRTIGKVYKDGQYINLLMVSGGHAWHYTQYAPKDGDLQLAEQSARAARLGLWQSPSAKPPWAERRPRWLKADSARFLIAY